MQLRSSESGPCNIIPDSLDLSESPDSLDLPESQDAPESPAESNPVTRVSDIMGWRLDLINKLTPPACAAQHVYYCGNRNVYTQFPSLPQR